MAAQEETKSTRKLQKSYFDVLGLCCPSEVPVIENVLNSIDGIKEISVIVPTRTVIVVHDSLLISPSDIVKALNQARLEANVRVQGEENFKQKWPSPYAVACLILLLLSFLKYVYHPLHWLALGAVAVGIFPIAWKGIIALKNLRIDINILAIIAVIGTIAMKDYVEAGIIVFLFSIAEWLESRASHKANAVMTSLMNLTPQKAIIAETGEEVDVGEVKLDTILAVKAGEVIPIDGVVVEGNCEVDEKTLTGESFPVSKEKDSPVWAGTINLNGYISVRTTALAEDCVVAKMAKLVEEAQNNKSGTQRLIDKCAKYYTPAVVILSASVAVIPLALRLDNLNHWFQLALVVLVSACPCALILSTPVATFCALTTAAKSGLLIKGGEYLETLANIKNMAFDKTGTITRGEFSVTNFQSLCADVSFNKLVYWVSSIESKSSHPMAAALIDYGRSLSIEPKSEDVEDFQNYPGEGIYGRINGMDIYIGNKKIAQRASCQTVANPEENPKDGKTIGYVYYGGKAAGVFSLSDACRTGVAEAIKDLNSLKIKTAMLTGDNTAAAMHAQNELGNVLDIVRAELLPEDKAMIIEEFKKEGPTAMIGDGLNDAPALATADIGISMGISGSALATETGHIVLMSNDIRKVPKAIRLARKARRKIIENVIISITTKAAIVALALAGHPLVWAAVLADMGTCLLVIFNSMLLLQGTEKHKGKCCNSSAAPKHGCHSNKRVPRCCSDNKGREKCELLKCTSQKCGSNCQSGHLGSTNCETTEGKCCNNSAHLQSRNHGCHSKDKLKNCCSDNKAQELLEPLKCSIKKIGSNCKSRLSGPACCETKNSSDLLLERTSAKNCERDSCNIVQQDNDSKCCEENHYDIGSQCIQENCCDETEHNDDRNCDLHTHKTEHNIHNHTCHLTSCEKDLCQDSIDEHTDCNVHNDKIHDTKGCLHGTFNISEQLNISSGNDCTNNEVPGNSTECSRGHQHHVMDNHGKLKCAAHHALPPHTAIDIMPANCKVDMQLATLHACRNLHKRSRSGCCKSYVKECCRNHGHLGASFTGGLSEIVITE